VLPGCTNSPGAALRAVIRPVIGLGMTRVGSASRLATMAGRKHLQRHVLIEVDAADGLLLDRKFVLTDRLDFDRCQL
jgi:hypothetical protein